MMIYKCGRSYPYMKLLDKKWKWAAVIILLPALFLLSVFIYQYFFYTCCALPPGSWPAGGRNDDSILDDPDLLYAERSFIGLCRTKSGDGGSCHFNMYLYSSGKLIIESGELAMMPDGEKATAYPTVQKELDKNTMDGIIKQIRDSGIMEKECEAEMITDYFVNYFINLDGIKKEARFPGCKAEFNAINKLIDTDANQ